MASKLDRWRRHDYPVPETMLAWEVTGAGFGNVGRGGRPVRVPVPAPARHEVLCRVDAVGLCFSDVKMILAGPAHPRILGRDLAANPTRGGHEASLTVAAVGEGERSDYSAGERYVVQPDVYFEGRSMAVGYAIPGALAQYLLVPEQVLHGDGGSYLVPIAHESMGYAEAALVEPWTCVEAAYRIAVRTGPREGGRTLVVNASPAGRPPSSRPSGIPAGNEVVVVDRPDADAVGRAARAGAPDAAEESDESPGFDDVIVTGGGPDSRELLEACFEALAPGGHLCLVAPGELPHEVSLDVGSIHYRGLRIVMSRAGGSVEEAYGTNTRGDILPGGAVLMSGAGGPMGQMHVQRAIGGEHPPRAVVVTDLAQDRLEHMLARLGPAARESGVELTCLNPGRFDGPSAFDQSLLALSGGRGFDDVVLCAPAGALVGAAVKLASSKPGGGGVVNIFAGLPVGTTTTIDLDAVARKRVRITGASGSGVEDMKRVIERAKAGRLRTRSSLGAVGGLEQVLEGLRGLKDARFPGKVVIFPGVADFPLTSPDGLGERLPEAARLLAPGGAWTREAEEAFLERMLAVPDD